jgi:hypothetical protein
MKMITLLANTFPIALSLAAPSLPELVALAFVFRLAMAGTVNSTVNITSARKQQNLIKPSVANRVIETPAFRLAIPLNTQKLTKAGTVNRLYYY